MRVAAVADIHIQAESYERDVHRFSPVNELADVLVIAGDFTNHGKREEMRACLRVLEAIHIPIVAVLGNHDYESGEQDELAGMLRLAGVNLLDGNCFEIENVGLAGTKGFCGGFLLPMNSCHLANLGLRLLSKLPRGKRSSWTTDLLSFIRRLRSPSHITHRS
ncbi:MAG TPA: metallophosphoesterase [Acidobacteriaceae bacterium]|jgi:Icc-related predicted phosphoesterase|nr:metallophosphoesterase [Acidobacteriaceae bacterium]